MGNANDSKDKEHALPTDDSQKTNRLKENSKRQNLKACIIQLTELRKAERNRWLPESEKTTANIENKFMRCVTVIKTQTGDTALEREKV